MSSSKSSSESSKNVAERPFRVLPGSAGAARPVRNRSASTNAPIIRKISTSATPRNETTVDFLSPGSELRKGEPQTTLTKVRVFKYGYLHFPDDREERTPDHFNPDNIIVPILHMTYDTEVAPQFLKGKSLLGYVSKGTFGYGTNVPFIIHEDEASSSASEAAGKISCHRISVTAPAIPRWTNLPFSRFTQVRPAGGRRRGPLYEPKTIKVRQPELVATREFPYGIKVSWSLQDGTTHWYPGKVDFKVKVPTDLLVDSAGNKVPGFPSFLYLLEYEPQPDYMTQQTFLVFIDKVLNIVIHPYSDNDCYNTDDCLYRDLICNFDILEQSERAAETSRAHDAATFGESDSSDSNEESDIVEVCYSESS